MAISDEVEDIDALRERVEYREAWKSSPERRKLKMPSIATAVVGVVASIVAYGIAFIIALQSPPGSYARSEQLGVAAGVGAGVAFGFIVLGGELLLLYRLRLRRQWKEKRALASTSADIEDAKNALVAGLSKEDALELSSLWDLTHSRLNYYHEIATGQARDSFRNAQIASAVGFFILAASIPIALIVAKTPVGSVVGGVLGAVAGATGSFISRTFVRSQDASAERLQAYFLQPLEFSRFLVAERLLNTASPETKAEGILRIVEGISRSPQVGHVASDQSTLVAEDS